MIDIKLLRENPQILKSSLDKRKAAVNMDELISLDKKDKALAQEIESLNQLRNKKSEEAGALKRQGKDISGIQKEMESVKEKVKALEDQKLGTSQALKEKLLFVPNILDASVPKGESERDNPVVKPSAAIPSKSFDVLPHWEIGEKLGVLDFKRASKLSGSRFSVLMGRACALERALINFMVELHVKKHGYKEVWPPFLVTPETMQGTGELPKFEEELFKCRNDELFLIPTAEVPVTNLHRDEILDEKDLPVKYVSYTACFRREAGSYGKDTRGLIRNHQFNKVELVKFASPDVSLIELEALLTDAEDVLKELGLPYRVIELCTSDVGFASAKTYDIEVWMPAEKCFREISSCSLFTDFQSRRLNIKFRDASKKLRFVHTLNGSGVAVGRTMAAIFENYQTKDKKIEIPEVLKKYLDFSSIE